jgi:DNA-binding transcriptional regulator YdaS (Cro superfamily)
MNALKQWQNQNKISNRALAKNVDVHESFISKYHKSLRGFSPSTALRIEEATGGAVSCMELLYPEQNKVELLLEKSPTR